MADERTQGTSGPGGGNSPERKVVEGYGPGRFRVSGTVHEGSVLILPEQVHAWPVTALAEVTLDSLAAVIAPEADIELLLIGCGARMAMVPADLRTALRERGIAIEAMDTGAAARTYNLLLSENRRVAAALIALDA